MDQPLLRLGLIGFSDADASAIAHAIGIPQEGWPLWQISDFEVADALCVDGQAVQALSGNSVQVRTYRPDLPTITLDPTQTKLPIAFTAPVPFGLEGVEQVNFKDSHQLRISLQRFEAWLRPMRAQFALGADLVAREQELAQGVYHVLGTNSQLVAVVNLLDWRVSMLPMARPIDFENANWVPRPSMAADMPPGFISMTVVELMWTYAVRTMQDVLPSRYRKDTVYLRRLPRLPQGWVRDEHLVILRALSSAAATFKSLVDITGLHTDHLARCLAALYFSGAITTNRKAAMHMERKTSPVGEQSNLSADAGIDSVPFGAGKYIGGLRSQAHSYRSPHQEVDLTAPAPLFIPGN